MLNWLKKKLTPADVQNRVGVSSAALSCLKADMFQIMGKDSKLGKALLRFVVDDEGDECLLKLAAIPDVGYEMRLVSCPNWQKRVGICAQRRELFRKGHTRDGGVLYRLGQVYYAAFKGQGTHQRRWQTLPDELGWFELLIREAYAEDWINDRTSRLEAEMLEAALTAAEADPGDLARLVLMEENQYGQHFIQIDGLGPYFARQQMAVLDALKHRKAQQRIHALNELARTKATLDPAVCAKVCQMATGSAKTVREAADNLLLATPTSHAKATELLESALTDGTNTERFHAVGALVRLVGETIHPRLREHLKAERAKKVKGELEKYLGIRTESTTDTPEKKEAYDDNLTVDPPRKFAAECELTGEQETQLHAAIERYNQAAIRQHTEIWDRTEKRWRRGSRNLPPPISAKLAGKLVRSLATPDVCAKRKVLLKMHHTSFPNELIQEMNEFVGQTRLSLVQVIRLGWAIGQIHSDQGRNQFQYCWMTPDCRELIGNHLRKHEPDLRLLDISAAFCAAGLNERWVERLYMDWSWGSHSNPLGLPDDSIWPFFYRNTKALEEAMGLRPKPEHVADYYFPEYRNAAYRVLATFPNPPKQFVTILWERALGTTKRERPLAQNCLRNYPGREEIIIRSLGDGQKAVRTSAAVWLGELHIDSAIKPIKKALEKEKQDEAKAAMMETLEKLGVDIDQFLNRKKLLAEAEKALKKPVHKDLQWFPFDQLPQVHWAKNKQKVPPEIVKHLLIQAFKLKSAEPNPLHRRYVSLMQPAERQHLGRFVFEAWLRQDTLPAHTHDEAAKLAEKDLQQMRQNVKQWPQYYPNFNEEAHRKSALNRFLNHCLGSANSSKGVLGIAAAAAGPEVVPTVERYLKEWYGQRLAQCKALVRMLSWIDHPLAIQLILAVGNRFRTKGIQQEAATCADLLAERKGWSRDEMADRTVPTAGFEADGTQIIDYGPRQFAVRLLEDFSIELRNPAGKVIKNLPDGTKVEDAAEVKVLKKGFSASKKELKQVLKLQHERLYEAMCVERQWRFEDWNTFLNQHPIVGRYCQGLVWLAKRDEEQVGSFRPLPDRTLSDFDDEEINLEPEDLVQLAHDAYLSVEDAAKWLEHLDDYEVEPLFQQFGKQAPDMNPAFLERTDIKDFEGHVVNSFKLRSRTTKLGYTRGMAEDGGWFRTYYKNFPGLKLQAVIDFTGNMLPEEDRNVALMSLYFIEQKPDDADTWSYSHRPLKLKNLPEVLVTECWNDLRIMSADGTGFDKDWQKTTGW